METIKNFLILAQKSIGEGAKEIGEEVKGATEEVGRGTGGEGGWTMLIFLAIFFIIMWLLLIRPQQKRAKKHQQFLKELKNGDNVVTSNGFIGKIVNISGEVAQIEIAKDVRVKMLKSQIANYFVEEQPQKAATKNP